MQNFLPTTNTTPGFLAFNYFTPGPSPGFNEIRNDKAVEFSIQPVEQNIAGFPNIFIPDYQVGDAFSMAIGNFDQPPTAGTVQLQLGVHTGGGLDAIAYNSTALALKTAFDIALAADSHPLANVLSLGNGSYIITGIGNGAVPSGYFAVASDALLYPTSNAFFTVDSLGSTDEPYRLLFIMRQAPMCYAEPTTPFTSVVVSVEPTQAQGAGQSAVRTVLFNVPQVSAGSFVLGATADGTTETCGTATPLMSAREFGILLSNHSKINYSTPNADDNISVTISGQAWVVTAIGDLFDDATFELTATDNADNPLVAPLGLSGSINYNTFGLVAYSLTAQTTEDGTFELTRQIQRTRGGETRTLYSGPVTIYKELIDAATAVPTPTINYYTAAQVDTLLAGKMATDGSNADSAVAFAGTLEVSGAASFSAVSISEPLDYEELVPETSALTPRLLRQWLAANRKDSYGVGTGGGGNGALNTGSGSTVAQYDAAAYFSTGTTNSSRTGLSWAKNTSPCPPGLGHYHYTYWGTPIWVSFRFGFPVTLASGACLIGYYGTDNTQRPTDQSWSPVFSGFGFQIRGDGSLRIYIDNQDTSTHTLHTTGATVNVTGASACLVQEVLFASDGAGNVSVFLNNQFVDTFTGMQTSESATDNYPLIALINQSSTATDNSILIFPMEIMSKAY